MDSVLMILYAQVWFTRGYRDRNGRKQYTHGHVANVPRMNILSVKKGERIERGRSQIALCKLSHPTRSLKVLAKYVAIPLAG